MNRLVVILVSLAALALPGSALAADRDRDGLPDRWERRHDLSTTHGSADKDPDRDRVDNGNEYRERTDPRDRDSDGDGRRDGREDADRDRLSNRAEDATGNDPRDRDTDDDGVPDGREHAGVVLSFDGGLLTLDLANGGTLTGEVTEETRIKCSSERAAERRHRGRARKAELERGASTGFEGEDEPGDDGYADEDVPGEGDEDYDGEEGDEDYDGEEGDEGDEKDEDYEDEDDGKRGKRDGRRCSQSSLRPGVGVQEAQLDLTPEGLFFESLELVR